MFACLFTHFPLIFSNFKKVTIPMRNQAAILETNKTKKDHIPQGSHPEASVAKKREVLTAMKKAKRRRAIIVTKKVKKREATIATKKVPTMMKAKRGAITQMKAPALTTIKQTICLLIVISYSRIPFAANRMQLY